MLADLGPDSRLAKVIRDGDLAVIAAPVDLLAVQYYTPYYVTGNGSTVTRWPTSQADWQQIYPEGMYDILTRVTRDYGPIPLTVTENGLPSPDRSARTARSTTPAGSPSCATTSPPRTGPSPTACRWRATTSGRCWTTSSGQRGTTSGGD